MEVAIVEPLVVDAARAITSKGPTNELSVLVSSADKYNLQGTPGCVIVGGNESLRCETTEWRGS